MFKTKLVVGGAMLAGLLLVVGCGDVTDLSNSWLDPSEFRVGDGYGNNALLVPVLSSLNSGFAEKTPDFTQAEPVQPEDLIYTPSDYTIGPGDLLNITLSDVSGQPGQETLKQTRVTDSGNITVPLLDPIRASGLTEAQLQKAIHDEYNEKGYIRNAEVSVTVIEARQRTFSITGPTAATGQYSIFQPNFRVLDALVLARVSPSVDLGNMYVVRPPVEETGAATQPAGKMPGTLTPPTGPTLPGILEPGAHSRTPATQGASIHFSTPSSEPVMPLEGFNTAEQPPKHVFVSGATTTESVGTESTTSRTPMASSATPATHSAAAENGKSFEFHSPLPESKSRIIRLPLNKLLGGDLRYNIVIHPNDTLIIAPPSTGEIYIGGHVLRTGVYSVTSRQITLTQAIIMAGMLDPLGIPQRTEIIRRTDNNQQIFYHVDLAMVFAGKQPDILLKPYDEVMVGTNALTNFLSAFRTAFRATYGFGFVYDANYGVNQVQSVP